MWKYKLCSKYVLEGEYEFLDSRKFMWAQSWGRIEQDGKRLVVEIYRDYAWDGCTPKFKVGNVILGVWDGFYDAETKLPQTYHASLVHDFLCQYYGSHKLSRNEVDKLFLSMLRERKFRFAGLYYLMVRLYYGVVR